MGKTLRMRSLLMVVSIALLAASCTPPGPQTPPAEQRDTGHVDSGGAGGGAM